MAASCGLTASRVFFAYARDGCFPFSSFFSQVNPITKTPVRAVWANYTVGILLLLLAFNTYAINAIFSLGAIAAYIAFITPVALRLCYVRDNFVRGPWHLGKYSKFVGLYAISFVLLMIPILNFPQVRGSNLDRTSMNWTVVVYFGPMFFAIFWYLVYARRWFKGPKIHKKILKH
jgi:amino acid transporter